MASLRFRVGFSLIELLVTVAIIGILLSVTVVGVQRARETARRMQCVSNLRQIGIAIQNHEGTYKVLPAGGNKGFGIHVSLLPFIEQQPLFDAIRFDRNPSGRDNQSIRQTRVKLLVCPTDSASDLVSSDGSYGTSYAANYGTGVQRYGYNGAFKHVESFPSGRLRQTDIRDGTSITIALSEVLIADGTRDRRAIWLTPSALIRPEQLDQFASVCREGSRHWGADRWSRGRSWINGDAGLTMYNHVLTPNSRSCTNGPLVQEGAYSATSDHPDGVNVLFLDGHVSFVSESVELGVWRKFGSRDGGEL